MGRLAAEAEDDGVEAQCAFQQKTAAASEGETVSLRCGDGVVYFIWNGSPSARASDRD
tara:strand:+ start:5805 stop:5978 length:174 start_codon:yes stop_codon:yes gene_type:complete